MSADLMRIRFSGQSRALLNRLERISPSLRTGVERAGITMLNRSGLLAKQAAQSAVPIDTGRLREDIIFKPATSFNDTVVVNVAPKDHVNRGGGSFYRRGGESNPNTRVIGSPALADLLNVGKYNRSRPSLAAPGFQSVSGKTTGWEDNARDQFVRELKRLLASAR